jgi:putative two-component system response regulator
MFLSGRSDPSNEAYGIELGAVDFVAKPFSKPVLLNRIKYHLQIDDIFRERTAQLLKLQNCIMFAMADIVEGRDKNTGGHIERTELYTKMLIDAMMERKVYYGELHNWDLDLYISSTRLHDVGKITIPSSILNKPSSLTIEEFQTMKTHTTEGEKIINKLIQQTGDVELLNNAKLTAAYHHEHWDGSGYPYGLKQTEIPLQGRIVAIIDVYDALVSERPYKKPLTEEEAISIIQAESGKHFDPFITRVFIEIKDQLKEAAAKSIQQNTQ